jgi:outer membrane protein insertion porin family
VRIAAVLAVVMVTAGAHAQPDPGEAGDVAPDAATAEPVRYRITGFVIRGDSKVKPRTLGYLSRTAIGDLIGAGDIPQLEQALLSSELFKTVSVKLEPAPGAVRDGITDAVIVVTAVDKHSWIAAPTVFVLPGNRAFGVGFAENNFRGVDQKFLLYGQLGTRSSLLLGSFLDPSYRGTKLTWRTDLYLYRRALDEYLNPHDDPRSSAIARITTSTYLGAGALVGWRFRWWLIGNLRLRWAWVYFRNAEDPSGAPLTPPESDGWDVSLQPHLTLDNRHHRHGVSWGSYVQIMLDASIPGLDDYGYQLALLRAFHSWRLFGEHELELRGHLNVGRHLPAQEELTLGGVQDLRGYGLSQFRGDLRAVARAEYSVPLFRWRFLSFRALAFYDTGYIGFHHRRETGRDYLANQLEGGYARNDAGAGLRVYLDNIVLPLLGFDLGYGLEGRSLEVYFELGLTDF